MIPWGRRKRIISAPHDNGARQQHRRRAPFLVQRNLSPLHQTLDSNENADVLATAAKTHQSEQGALKQSGIDLLVMPLKLKGRLPLW